MFRQGDKFCPEVGGGAQAGFSNQIGWWVCSAAVQGYWPGSLVGRGISLYPAAVGWDYSLLHDWVESLAEIPICASPYTVFTSQGSMCALLLGGVVG